MNVSEGSPPDRKLPCPRCSYDLRGESAGWQSQCPVVGRCAECGLDFEWRLVFLGLELPLWSIESRGRPIRSFIGTSARLFFAPLYWRAMRLEHPLRRDRVFVFTIIWLLLAFASPYVIRIAQYATLRMAHTDVTGWSHSAPVGSTFILGGDSVSVGATSASTAGLTISHELWSIPQPEWTSQRDNISFYLRLPELQSLDGVFGTYFLAVQLAAALAFIVLPITRRRARVARHHFIRPVAAAVVMTCMVQVMLASLSLVAGIVRVFERTYYHLNASWTFVPSPYDGPILDAIVGLEFGSDEFKYAATLLLLLLWTIGMWYFVCRAYFRMDRAIMVCLSVVSIGILLPIFLPWARFVLTGSTT